jgi:hypothetical protein
MVEMFLFKLKVLSQKRTTQQKVKIMTTATIMREQVARELQPPLETPKELRTSTVISMLVLSKSLPSLRHTRSTPANGSIYVDTAQATAILNPASRSLVPPLHASPEGETMMSVSVLVCSSLS